MIPSISFAEEDIKMNENDKPILQFIVNTRSKFVNKASVEALSKLAKKLQDKYKVIATPEDVDIRATNTTVVQLSISADMEMEKIQQMLDYLDALPSVDRKLDNITEEQMQGVLNALDEDMYEYFAFKYRDEDEWDKEIEEEQNHLVDEAREYAALYPDEEEENNDTP